ncbi:ERVV2 protein, partial [Urocolius indicus]|nr:ERVV2 protein [Urocolius indicus]
FHSFARWFLPWLGVSELEKTVVNISVMMEGAFNATSDILPALKAEVRFLTEVVCQNRMALDLLTLKEGGVCTMINQSFCVHGNKDQKKKGGLE